MRDGEARERILGWSAVTLAWLVWGAINTARMHAIVPDITWPTACWYGLPDALIWAALTPLVVLLTRRFARSGRSYLKTLPVHVAAAVATSLFHSAADTTVAMVREVAGGSPVAWWPIFVKLLTYSVHANLLVYFLISGFAYYLHSSRRLARRRQRTAELDAQLTEARLANLQMQLRPHFLFNALHTVSGLIVTEPERAQRVIRQLGELLRASFQNSDRKTVPLAEEMASVEAYLEVERARFGGRLGVELAVEEGLAETRVPALILQPLVENAIRHGVSNNPAGGRLLVAATARDGRLRLEVEDDGPGLSESDDGDGVGLSNTRARLEALYGDDHRFSIAAAGPRGVRVTIDLPRGEATS